MSAPNLLNLSMASHSRRGPSGITDVDLAVTRFRIQIVPCNEFQVLIARQAFAKYGNFGDCIAYALSKETGEELLFKGTGFAQTDIAVAAY
jgi:ribonuclease VapC